MINIPNQLLKQRFIFIKSDNSKRPLQTKWNSINNYDYDNNIFQEYINKSKIYGIPTGINNLIVLDFDDKITQDKLLPFLPETFTVYSANKRLYHLYYYTDDVNGRRFNDKTTGKRILDLQGDGQYVIGVNSELGNGKIYDLAIDKPINNLYKADLDIALKKAEIDFVEVDSIGKKEKKINSDEIDMFLNNEAVRIKKNIKISEILTEFNIPIYKNPTMCPLGHESELKACFSFNDDKGLWHCFHCGKSGDTITLYQLLHGFNNFNETKTALFGKLFIDNKGYDSSMKEIQESIIGMKHPRMTDYFIDTIAKLIIKEFSLKTIMETDKILYYDKETGFYRQNGEKLIHRHLEYYFNLNSKSNITNEIIAKIKRIDYTPIKNFNSHKKLICLKNGAFNLETKLLAPHSSEHLFLGSSPINYNITATCPKIDKFFNEVYDNPNLLYEICCFLLLKHNRHEKAIVLVGNGKNGKSVYLSLCKNFVGEENVSCKSLQTLSEDKFATSSLFGKMVNISADIPDKSVMKSDVFKTLVSGKDLVDAQYKNQNSFQYVNNAKLLFSCNNLPYSNDSSDGFMRKWCILKFNKTFEGANENKNLIDDITDEDEMSGLFNHCMKIYNKVDVEGLDYTENTDEIRKIYTNLSNPLKVFLDEYYEENEFSEVNFKDFYDDYCKFLTNNKMACITKTALGLLLNRRHMKKRLSNSIHYIIGYKRISDDNNEIINI